MVGPFTLVELLTTTAKLMGSAETAPAGRKETRLEKLTETIMDLPSSCRDESKTNESKLPLNGSSTDPLPHDHPTP